MRISKFIIILALVSLIRNNISQGRRIQSSHRMGNFRFNFRFVYGPVSSWRLGLSLGIDPVSGTVSKICSFDCIYCQAGPTQILSTQRKIFVNTDSIIEEVRRRLSLGIKPDFITFAGRGEPALAENLGEIIAELKKITNIPIAVLSNASLIAEPEVQKDLMKADFVILKLDAYDEKSFQAMNRPHGDLSLWEIINGIMEFGKKFKGKLGIQIMFTNLNKDGAEEIAKIVRQIQPDQIQLNTPLRPRLSDMNKEARELTSEEMREIKAIFEKLCPGIEIIMVYDYLDNSY
jgi:wyosine [tRNA(Phe)-imidazoG37] synthetase (radical SAM superfamily)